MCTNSDSILPLLVLGFMLGAEPRTIFFSSRRSRMKKTISSPFTVFFKFIWPGIWLTVGLFISLGLLTKGAWLEVLLGVILIWLPGAFLCYWKQIPLKKVSIDEQCLYVSNYVKEIRIPFRNVEQVREIRGFFNMPRYMIWLELKSPSEFGHLISFVPGAYIKDVANLLREGIVRGVR
jgi:hypothetical protein